MLEALAKKDSQLQQHIAELQNRKIDGLISEVLFEKLKLELQILLARNLKELHEVVL